MSVPNHSILPATEIDLPTIASFVHASKIQLAINRFVFQNWPNESVQRALYTNAVESSFKDPLVTLLKVVDDISGDIVAHLVLTRRGAGDAQVPPGDADGNQSDVPHGLDPEVIATVTRMTKEVDKEMEGIDHIQITHIYVKPSSRKQGIGSQLLRLSLEKAKDAGVPLAVASEPAAHDFFVKQGFKDIKHADVDLSQWAPAHSGWGVFRLSGMSMSH